MPQKYTIKPLVWRKPDPDHYAWAVGVNFRVCCCGGIWRFQWDAQSGKDQCESGYRTLLAEYLTPAE